MSSSKRKKKEGIPVVLGGGGMRGASLLGFLDFLDEEGVVCSDYTGVSIGSIVATFRTNGVSTEQLRKVFSQELFRYKLFSWVKALVPPIFSPLRLLGGGFVDTLAVMTEMVEKFGLTTQDNLRIIAFDLIKREPVVFEGHDYPLPIALAASCAVPGVMRPIPYEKDGRSYMLVDGGVYHLQPGEFCDKPAIIAKLVDVPGMGMLFPDRKGDFVASVGKPWSMVFTRLNDEDVADLHKFGYDQAKQALLKFIRCGDIPVVTPA